MKKTNKMTKKHKRLIFFGSISVSIICYALFSTLSYTFEIKKLANNEKKLNNQLVELKEDGENLKTEIKKLKDPDYLARYARENYLYSKDDEYIIKIDRNTTEEESEEKNNTNNKILFFSSLGLSSIIIIYILTKKR
ncbi:MAG TPA: septum formation initiator family protein [Tenericutes bacterium]|nr:septum formation initiator family protein [Mycoplasmatota bacterium]